MAAWPTWHATNSNRYLAHAARVGALPGLWAEGLQVEGGRRCARLVSGVTASRALIEAAIARRRRRDLRAPRPVLARPGRPRHRLDEAARLAPAAGARHQPVRLPPAAGCASRARQQRAVRRAARAAGRRAASASRSSASSARRHSALTTAGAGRARGAACWAARRCWSPGDGRAADAHRLVHRRRAGLLRGGHRGRRRRLLTGEISEPQAHFARETGVAFLACGHHATERYGAPARRRARGRALRARAPIHRHRQPGMTAHSPCWP